MRRSHSGNAVIALWSSQQKGGPAEQKVMGLCMSKSRSRIKHLFRLFCRWILGVTEIGVSP